MRNFAQFMKQAQKLQEQMAQAQSAVENMETQGEAGGGMVKITVNGKGAMKNVTIDPSLLKDAEAEILEDLLVAAYNDAKSKADAMAQTEMEKAGAGFNIPAGMNMPL